MKPDDDDDNEGSFFFFFFHKPLENSKLTWKSFFFSFCLCVSQALGITESLSITADNLGEEGGNSKVWATFICRLQIAIETISITSKHWWAKPRNAKP
jgi:hypothetical protein